MREKVERDGDEFWYRCDRCKTFCSWKFVEANEALWMWDICAAGWTKPSPGMHWCPSCSKRDPKPAPNFIALAREWLTKVNTTRAAGVHAVAVRVSGEVIVGRFDGFDEVAASARYPDAACVLRSLENELAKTEAIRAAEAEVAAAEQALRSAKQRLDKARAMEGR